MSRKKLFVGVFWMKGNVWTVVLRLKSVLSGVRWTIFRDLTDRQYLHVEKLNLCQQWHWVLNWMRKLLTMCWIKLVSVSYFIIISLRSLPVRLKRKEESAVGKSVMVIWQIVHWNGWSLKTILMWFVSCRIFLNQTALLLWQRFVPELWHWWMPGLKSRSLYPVSLWDWLRIKIMWNLLYCPIYLEMKTILETWTLR